MHLSQDNYILHQLCHRELQELKIQQKSSGVM